MTCVWTHNMPGPMSAAISAHSWNPLEKWWGSVPSRLYGWFEEGMLLPSAPAPHIPKVPKRFHSEQSHKLFMSCSLQASSMPPTFTRRVQKVSWYLSGILIIQVLMIENNGGQKVCIIAWQFSAFNLSTNRCTQSELSYSTNLHRLVPNPDKFFKQNLLPHFDHLDNFYLFLFCYKMWVQFTNSYSLD
jgi:hypothetical protein